jgi:deazaflavin-dependent oxidoreductase (nitroreductase family)
VAELADAPGLGPGPFGDGGSNPLARTKGSPVPSDGSLAVDPGVVASATRSVLAGCMPIEGEYEASPAEWVRKQVEEYEGSGGTEGTTLRGMPVIILTSRGSKSGKIRKTPLMRVEHEGSYAVVASKGGAPEHPVWYYNLVADPHVELQDGPAKWDMTARQVTGDEKATWWKRAVDAYPDYADYQEKTDREIPVFVLEPVAG